MNIEPYHIIADEASITKRKFDQSDGPAQELTIATRKAGASPNNSRKTGAITVQTLRYSIA